MHDSPTESIRLESTLTALARALAGGTVSSRTLVERCLASIAAPDGEGVRTFLKVHAEQARATADWYDTLRRTGSSPGRFGGIPISIKDLFDVAGDVTTAGSTVLENGAKAERDALAVARLRAAGFIVIGRTNMTEFAFSGLGMNPHYGTPLNPWDRPAARIPGGSSSGAAVSITDGMAFAALGTDTGGSCRIPAAMCGIVGFKPTARRVPKDGTFPLSTTLDSVGPLGHSVRCCSVMDAILSDETMDPLEAPRLEASELRLGVLTSYVTDGLVPEVAAAFEDAIRRLSSAGTRLVDVGLPQLAELREINRKGGLPTAEAYAQHRELLNAQGHHFDPRVASRILRAREQDAADYIQLHSLRANLIARIAPQIAHLDGVLMPTVPILAPRIAELATDEDYARTNMLALRNSAIVNFLDGCAISLPIHAPGRPPVGLSLFGLADTDRHLLLAAEAIEAVVRPT